MPNYRAVTNGNWSSLATWQDNASGSFVASTVLPGVNDDVYTNNFTVTINQNATVLSLRNTSATGITAGGRFLLTNGITVNATGTGLVGGSATLVEFNLAAPNSATLNYSMADATTNNGNNGVVLLSGTGTLNCNGSWQNGSGSFQASSCIFNVTANGILNIIGNCTHYNTNSGNAIRLQSVSATLNWTGNMPVNYTNQNSAAFIGNGVSAGASTSTINVTGSLTNSLPTGAGAGIATNGVCNVIGTLTPFSSGTFSAVILGGTGSTITVVGLIQSNTSRHLTISTSGLLTVSGQIICINEGWPISANRLRLANATPTQMTFQTDSVGVNKTLYEPGTALGNPATTDVRQGVSYASGALTGTLVVPSPANVRRGVPTDNTVGTADLTAQDFFTAIANSSDPIAVRLRNVATVQTTGDQIAAAL